MKDRTVTGLTPEEWEAFKKFTKEHTDDVKEDEEEEEE